MTYILYTAIAKSTNTCEQSVWKTYHPCTFIYNCLSLYITTNPAHVKFVPWRSYSKNLYN